ncbi:MAG: hypothetical protein MJ237_07555 [bacterium]|nr:hypothetical protein [bacterium]
MKKLFGIIITIILTMNLYSYASDIEIQPTMKSRSNSQDRVWVGTFQIVWNDFIFKYVHNPVRFWEGTPIIAQELNLQEFDTNEISDSCYYKYSGSITKNTKNNIKKAIKRKFKETSDILDKIELTPSKNSFLIYVMLKKDFEFLQEFDKLGSLPFAKTKAEFFGIKSSTDSNVRQNVKVLFYNSPDDFAVKLITRGNDEVIVYKNSSNKNFNDLYYEVKTKTARYTGIKTLNDKDELRIPNIKFNISRDFDELCNKRITGTNLTITKAIETVKFDMDNKGVKLKSEAAMAISKTALMPNTIKPRYFYYNNTFNIFLKEQNKEKPYFALRVHDISKYQ